MRVGIPRERAAGEHRVALTPTAVKRLVAKEVEVVVETDAGEEAGFLDDAYREAGATVVDDDAAASDADLVLRVGPVAPHEVENLAKGTALVGFLEPFTSADVMRHLADKHITALAMEAVPRITAAQSIDALSSQATASGYAAVLLAAYNSHKFFPMLTTAAGTVPPSKVLVLGAGVAGLQAIATAKRLGAVVSAYDVRAEVAEQIKSLGAKPLNVPAEESGDESGYAKEVSKDTQKQQLELLAPHVADADIVITTAAIPGKRAPLLITDEMVRSMRAGSVIVDIAAATGGNCEVTRAGERVVHDEVVVLGPTDLPSRVAHDSSQMYARNLLTLLDRVIVEGELVIDLEDPIVGPTCVAHRGEVRHRLSRQLLGLEVTE